MVINCNEQMSAVDRWGVEHLAEIGLSLNHMFHGSQTVIGLPSPKILRETISWNSRSMVEKVFSWTWDFRIPSKFWGPYIDWVTTRHFYQGCWWPVWKLNRFGFVVVFRYTGCRNTPPVRRRNNSISQGHLFSCYILYMKKDSNSKFTSIYFLKQLKNATAHAWPSFLNFCCIRAIQSPGYPFAGQGMFWERW